MYFKMKISVIIKIRCLFTMCISKFLTFRIRIYSPNNNNFKSEVKECFLGAERASTQICHKRAPTHKVYQNLNITGFTSQVRSSLIQILGLPNNCPGLIGTGLWHWQKLLKKTRDSSSVIQKARHWMVELFYTSPPKFPIIWFFSLDMLTLKFQKK